MSARPSPDWVVLEAGEPAGWIASQPGFRYGYGGDNPEIHDALSEAGTADEIDASPGPGGNTEEARRPAPAAERARRAAEAAGAVFGASVVPAEQARPGEAEAALEASGDGHPPQAEKLWVPYEGPRGGEGWKNVTDGRIEYTQSPPGDVAESPEELRKALEDRGALEGSDLISGERTLDVSLAEDAPVYAIDGRPAPTLTVAPGAEVSFDADGLGGEPLYIATSPGGGGYDDALETGVTVEGADGERHAVEEGRLVLEPSGSTGDVYYCSTNSPGMGGRIHVTDEVTGSSGWAIAEKARPDHPWVPCGDGVWEKADTGERIDLGRPDRGPGAVVSALSSLWDSVTRL